MGMGLESWLICLPNYLGDDISWNSCSCHFVSIVFATYSYVLAVVVSLLPSIMVYSFYCFFHHFFFVCVCTSNNAFISYVVLLLILINSNVCFKIRFWWPLLHLMTSHLSWPWIQNNLTDFVQPTPNISPA